VTKLSHDVLSGGDHYFFVFFCIAKSSLLQSARNIGPLDKLTWSAIAYKFLLESFYQSLFVVIQSVEDC
jgi:hypothetical protein